MEVGFKQPDRIEQASHKRKILPVYAGIPEINLP